MRSPVSADFLFELYTQEIPASYQARLEKRWKNEIPTLLKKYDLVWDKHEVFATCRRMAFLIHGLAKNQPEKTEIVKGPPKEICYTDKGHPTPALQGFAQKVGFNENEVLFEKSPKGEYAMAKVTLGGKPSMEVMPLIIDQLLKSFNFPRSMRWANGETVYARPIIQYYCAYLDKTGLPLNDCNFLREIPIGKTIFGHPILGNEINNVTGALYATKLKNQKVIASASERKEKIQSLLQHAAEAVKQDLIHDLELLDEVNFLVENPGVIECTFPEEFLRLPENVILSEMKEHQRYFALRKNNGEISHHFLVVSNGNIEDAEAVKNIREGNEKVLVARLSDGAFFYDEDTQRTLASRIEDLKSMVFQEGLGSMHHKTNRLARLVNTLAGMMYKQNEIKTSLLERAALLCKADLTTQLVYEFDHLQGEIGAVYAGNDSEQSEVVQAIREHYKPKHNADSLPQSDYALTLSMADKMDNLCAGFILGRQPTSSQDPYGLRRQALYILKMAIESGRNFSLTKILEFAVQQLQDDLSENAAQNKKNPETVSLEIWEFLKSRFVTVFEKEGFDKKLIRAGVYSGSDDVVEINRRLLAIKRLQNEGSGALFMDLMAAFVRMNNILNDYSGEIDSRVNESLFQEKAEKDLWKLSCKLQEYTKPKQKDFYSIFAFMAKEKNIVDSFFDSVMVMSDDESIRKNRVALLFTTIEPVKKLLDLKYLL